MKTLVNAVFIGGGITGALTLNRQVSTPLVAKGLQAVGVFDKIPAWGKTVLSDLLTAGHVVAGVALGTGIASAINKKVA